MFKDAVSHWISHYNHERYWKWRKVVIDSDNKNSAPDKNDDAHILQKKRSIPKCLFRNNVGGRSAV